MLILALNPERRIDLAPAVGTLIYSWGDSSTSVLKGDVVGDYGPQLYAICCPGPYQAVPIDKYHSPDVQPPKSCQPAYQRYTIFHLNYAHPWTGYLSFRGFY